MELFVVCMLLRGKVNAYDKNGNKIGKIIGATLITIKEGFKENNILVYIENLGEKDTIPLEKVFFKEKEIIKRIEEINHKIQELKEELNEAELSFVIKDIEEEIFANEKSIEIFNNYVSLRKIP